ncbi:hypothetical protein ACMFMF_000663 [Clarireedia jacksonii]
MIRERKQFSFSFGPRNFQCVISYSMITTSRTIYTPDDSDLDADISKLQFVFLEDWIHPYPENVREELKGADACIWALAVTPSKSKTMSFADVSKICVDYTINGLTIMRAIANKPFRFAYVSGSVAERDQSKSLYFLSDYRLL